MSHLHPPFPSKKYGQLSVGFFGKPENFSNALTAVTDLEQFTHVVKLDQVHGTNCLTITRSEQLRDIEKTPADACVTTLPNVLLSVKVADCAPILFAGKSRDAQTAQEKDFVGVIHAGRKGTDAGILAQTFQTITQRIGEVTSLTTWFGPAICKQCYEINPKTRETYDLLGKNQAQFTDFWKKKTAAQVIMHDSNRCTLHEPEHFHSYRRSGAGTPMNFGFIGRW